MVSGLSADIRQEIVNKQTGTTEGSKLTVSILLVEDGMRGDEYLAFAVLKHIQQTVGGIVIVQGDICTTSLLNADGCHEEFLLVAEHDADEVVLLDTQLDKPLGKGTGQVIQSSIAVGSCLVDDGGSIGRCRCLLHKQRRERGLDNRNRLALTL